MDSAETIPQTTPELKDFVDQAAYTLGAPALGLYLYLQLKKQNMVRPAFLSSEVRIKLKIKDHATFKKYLDQIGEAQLARVIFTPRGDSFLFERVVCPPVSVPTSTEWTAGVEGLVQDQVAPPRTEIFRQSGPAANPEVPKISDQLRKNRTSSEKIGPAPKISDEVLSKTSKDFGVGVESLNLKTPPTPSLQALEDLLTLAAVKPISHGEIKIFLGQKIIDLAMNFESTLTIPGHLLHAWQESIRFDGKDLPAAIERVKNSVLYCVQQKALGIPIRNRVGYFFDAIRKARTPSIQPEKKIVLEKLRPAERTADEIQKEKENYWQSLTFDELKSQYETLKKIGLGDMSKSAYRSFLEGVALSKFRAEFNAWAFNL